MTSYRIPEPKTMRTNDFVRAALALNKGNYPRLVKRGGTIYRKQDNVVAGAPDYIACRRFGGYMTGVRAMCQIAEGEALPVNVEIVNATSEASND